MLIKSMTKSLNKLLHQFPLQLESTYTLLCSLEICFKGKWLNLSDYTFTSQPKRHIGIGFCLFVKQYCASCQVIKTLRPSIVIFKSISLFTFCCPEGD